MRRKRRAERDATDAVSAAIPRIDVAPLFGPESAARTVADHAIASAAADPGFMTITGLPPELAVDAGVRSELLRIFRLPAVDTRRLWRRKFEPGNPNVYRGWFPLQTGNLTSKEGIDLGADIAHGRSVCRPGDPLREPTPTPPAGTLPGWHDAAARYYRGMECLCRALTHSLARSLALAEDFFDPYFERGLSTLRLLRYPVREDLAALDLLPGALWQAADGSRRYVMGAPHVDSGLLTAVAQDGVAGLEARASGGAWLPVPADPGAFAINFGRVLERWSRGRIRATEHRVVGSGAERFSVAYFHEVRAEALIRPLPADPPDAFEPFVFGDYLWSTMTQFVEFHGMETLRRADGAQRR
jgi:isopenicillin N synthase-like dioxygenase